MPPKPGASGAAGGPQGPPWGTWVPQGAPVLRSYPRPPPPRPRRASALGAPSGSPEGPLGTMGAPQVPPGAPGGSQGCIPSGCPREPGGSPGKPPGATPRSPAGVPRGRIVMHGNLRRSPAPAQASLGPGPGPGVPGASQRPLVPSGKPQGPWCPRPLGPMWLHELKNFANFLLC